MWVTKLCRCLWAAGPITSSLAVLCYASFWVVNGVRDWEAVSSGCHRELGHMRGQWRVWAGLDVALVDWWADCLWLWPIGAPIYPSLISYIFLCMASALLPHLKLLGDKKG